MEGRHVVPQPPHVERQAFDAVPIVEFGYDGEQYTSDGAADESINEDTI